MQQIGRASRYPHGLCGWQERRPPAIADPCTGRSRAVPPWMTVRADLFAARARAASSPLVQVAAPEDARAWNSYVARRPDATLYHLFGWKTVAEEAYGLRSPFL